MTDEERAGVHLARFEGITVPTGKLLGLERRGWTRGEPQDAGIQGWFSREAGPDRHVLIDLDPGIVVGYLDEFPEQKLNAIWINSSSDGWRPKGGPLLRFGELDPLPASEILADLTELTGGHQ